MQLQYNNAASVKVVSTYLSLIQILWRKNYYYPLLGKSSSHPFHVFNQTWVKFRKKNPVSIIDICKLQYVPFNLKHKYFLFKADIF